jgi:hypothetical protein
MCARQRRHKGNRRDSGHLRRDHPSLPNDLPFSSERQGRVRAYHGREESRARPAASRHEPSFGRKGVAFGCCNGWLDAAPI